MAKLSLEKKTELVAHCMGTTDGYIKNSKGVWCFKMRCQNAGGTVQDKWG
ncbi:MAG: hypothetical protein IKA80_12320 [Spirochaetaceae bacterium]|nr:hypothetical protein [Spirochaetaceae bacterium]